MARSRNIKPGFFKNDLLAELPPLTRLLFIGLWTIADKEGRLEDRPRRIKAECLPYDDGVDIDQCLNELAESGFLIRYQVGSQKYLQIPNWSKHQQPHVKEKESEIPEFKGDTKKHRKSTKQAPDKNQKSTEDAALIPDSLNLIPDTGFPSTHTVQSGDWTPPAFDQKAGFEEAWTAYPKKEGRKAAERHYFATIKDAPTHDRLMKALGNYKRLVASENESRKNGDSRPWMHGKTWFNNWRDYEQIEIPCAGLDQKQQSKPTTFQRNRSVVDEWLKKTSGSGEDESGSIRDDHQDLPKLRGAEPGP